MKNLLKWFGALAAIVLVSGTAVAEDQVAAGKVKTVSAEKKEFVLTDGNDKDRTFKFGDNIVINRGHKEGANDLKAGDKVNVAYDKGLRTWTAQYVLIQEDESKNCYLVLCTFKSFDADKKQLVYTDAAGKDCTIPMGSSKVRLNGQDSKIEDVKIGDKALAIVQKVGDTTTLMDLMVGRKS